MRGARRWSLGRGPEQLLGRAVGAASRVGVGVGQRLRGGEVRGVPLLIELTGDCTAAVSRVIDRLDETYQALERLVHAVEQEVPVQPLALRVVLDEARACLGRGQDDESSGA